MSLEDKLKEILEPMIPDTNDNSVVLQIIQAFKDEGWVKTVILQNKSRGVWETSDKEILMTGQEWCTRLEDNINLLVDSWNPFEKNLGLPEFMESAKKASGL